MLKRLDRIWESPAVIHMSENVSVPGLVFDRIRREPDQVIVERRVGQGWHEVRGSEFRADATGIARGLYALGVRPGKAVAILAPTSYEWATLDMAIMSLGAMTVPIYESDSAAQITHILNDSKSMIVVTNTVQQAELINSLKKKHVRHVFALERGDANALVRAGRNVSEETVEDLLRNVKMSDTASIVYTSGTTGPPKGVIITHSNFVLTVMNAYGILPTMINDPQSRTLLFLPVAHVLARYVMMAILIGEGRLGFSPDISHLIHDIETFKPTLLLVVPRVLEKIYNTATQRAGSGMKRTIFSWSAQQARNLSQETAYPKPPRRRDKTRQAFNDRFDALMGRADVIPEPPPEPPRLDGAKLFTKAKHSVASALVLRKIKALMGPNLTTIICGGAPLSADLANFYRGLGIDLLQGYGLSETTGPIVVQPPGDNPPDSVGYLWPGNALRIAEDGELLLRGASVSPGYHNLPKVNAEAFKDGWFHTGDLASVDPEGRIRITGRKKELIVTAGGKNVSPDILQDSLVTHPLISQVIVAGDGKPYITAMITLDPEMLPIWLRNKGLDVVPPSLAIDLPEVRDSLTRAIERANQQVSRAESIRRYRLLDRHFTVEDGYLTPSLKLKRSRVLEDFAEELDEIYDATEEELEAFGASVTPRAAKLEG